MNPSKLITQFIHQNMKFASPEQNKMISSLRQQLSVNTDSLANLPHQILFSPFQKFLIIKSNERLTERVKKTEDTKRSKQDKRQKKPQSKDLNSEHSKESLSRSRQKKKHRRQAKKKALLNGGSESSKMKELVMSVNERKNNFPRQILPIKQQTKQMKGEMMINEGCANQLVQCNDIVCHQSGHIVSQVNEVLPANPLNLVAYDCFPPNIDRPIFHEESNLNSILPGQTASSDHHSSRHSDNENDPTIVQVEKSGPIQPSNFVPQSSHIIQNNSLNCIREGGNNVPSLSQRQLCYKTKICSQYLKGKCKKLASECRYAHGEEDRRTINKSKSYCRNFLRGQCKKNHNQCRFWHPKPNSKDSIADSAKKMFQDKQPETKIQTSKEQLKVAQSQPQKSLTEEPVQPSAYSGQIPNPSFGSCPDFSIYPNSFYQHSNEPNCGIPSNKQNNCFMYGYHPFSYVMYYPFIYGEQCNYNNQGNFTNGDRVPHMIPFRPGQIMPYYCPPNFPPNIPPNFQNYPNPLNQYQSQTIPQKYSKLGSNNNHGYSTTSSTCFEFEKTVKDHGKRYFQTSTESSQERRDKSTKK